MNVPVNITTCIQVIECTCFVKTCAILVKQSWRERLFSWPWCPFKTHRLVFEERTDDNVYWMDGALFCHPIVARKVRAQLVDIGIVVV